jgi:hypothetical protein
MSATAPAPAAAGTRRRIPPTAIALFQALAVIALILFLTRLAFLQPRTFNGDLINDAWYIRHQADALRTNHAPSLYLTSISAALYPVFAFYGGTLFVVAAALSLLTGSAFVAEAIVYVIAFAAAYGGWYWLARMAGVRGWLAHTPGIVYVTAPYVLTNLYVRQDLVETVATAAMPLMVASALSVGRADRLRLGPAAALAASTIAFTGSHNLTLLWGTMFLVLMAACVAVAVPPARRLISGRGGLRILAVMVPSVAVNAWFLLPDLFYSHDTAIAQRLDDARTRLRAPNDQRALSHLLTPGRPDSGTAGGFTLPVLALGWTLLAAAVHRSRRPSPWLRLVVVLTLCTLGITLLISQAHILAHLPRPFVLLQLGERLVTFALFGICGALIAALALIGRPARWLSGLLALVLAVGLGQAVQQTHHVERHPEVPATLALDRWITFGLGDYADGTTPIVSPPANAPIQGLTHDLVHGNRAVLTVEAPPGGPFLVNVMAPASLLRIEGAKVVGRWALPPFAPGWQSRWHLALEIPWYAEGQRHTVVISAAQTLPIVAGKIISTLALLSLTAMAVVLTWRRWPRLPRPRVPRPRPRPEAAP